MHERLSWALAACSRVLRPLVRLSLGMGLKYQDLDEMLRNLLIEDARRVWKARGVERPNVSQLSVTTGLNRKDVTLRLRGLDDALPRTEWSSASKTFTLWLQMAARDPAKRRLPKSPAANEPTFETVARQASRGDVHHRSVLDELVRLGMVVEGAEYVELSSEAFVPAQDQQAMLAFLGDNTRDHLEAAVSNTLGNQPAMLERAVFVGGMSDEDCARIELLARQRWDTLHRELFDQMQASLDAATQPGTRRIRVGIYAYHEDERDTGVDAAPHAPQTKELK
ncbi:MAG: hypothetical protein H7332_17175 [Bdellovibrionales bacterium]|nr:hypothetical protein [Ramlibacter sp.]